MNKKLRRGLIFTGLKSLEGFGVFLFTYGLYWVGKFLYLRNLVFAEDWCDSYYTQIIESCDWFDFWIGGFIILLLCILIGMIVYGIIYLNVNWTESIDEKYFTKE